MPILDGETRSRRATHDDDGGPALIMRAVIVVGPAVRTTRVNPPPSSVGLLAASAA
jgi:hypothetical protein